ncbi:MAG: ribosome-associated translation inhibitor RaiA [Clostridiaceae bacterium]|nr:ribosome-associated translation inhibitor RaiA [Clostridiaceae bacterium]
MNFIVSGKNIDITEALRNRVVKKLGKLDKFFNPDTDVYVTMSVEKSRHIVEVTIPFNGVVLRAEEESDDMYASIDKVIDVLEGQIRRNKTRLKKKIYDGSIKTGSVNGLPKTGAIKAEYFEQIENQDDEEEREFKVVKSKKFAIKPMSVDEAILQMNLLGHEFFVFSNAETDDVNVVYKRKDGNYGLIEPEY